MQDKVEFDHMIIIYDHMISLCIISYDAFWRMIEWRQWNIEDTENLTLRNLCGIKSQTKIRMRFGIRYKALDLILVSSQTKFYPFRKPNQTKTITEKNNKPLSSPENGTFDHGSFGPELFGILNFVFTSTPIHKNNIFATINRLSLIFDHSLWIFWKKLVAKYHSIYWPSIRENAVT